MRFCGQMSGAVKEGSEQQLAFGRRQTETAEQGYCTQKAVDVQKLHGMANTTGWIEPRVTAFGDGNFDREGCIVEDNTWWKARMDAARQEGAREDGTGYAQNQSR